MDEETARLLAKRDARITVLEMRVESLENLVGLLNNRIISIEQTTVVKSRGAVAGKGGVAIAGDCRGGVNINTGQ